MKYWLQIRKLCHIEAYKRRNRSCQWMFTIFNNEYKMFSLRLTSKAPAGYLRSWVKVYD